MNLVVALALVAVSFGPAAYVLMLRRAIRCRCEADGYALTPVGFNWLVNAMWLPLAVNTTWVTAAAQGACVVLVLALLLYVARTIRASRWLLAGWVAGGIALTAVGFAAPIATAIALIPLEATQIGLAIRAIVRSKTAEAVSTSSWVMEFAFYGAFIEESIRGDAMHTAALACFMASLYVVGAVVTFNAHRRAPATLGTATPA